MAMSETVRTTLLAAAGLAAFVASRMVEPGLLNAVLLGVSCGAVFIALALPTGALIEGHTGERVVKWIWFVVLGFFAACTFVSFYGVGEATQNIARQSNESTQSTEADRKLGTLTRGPLD